MVSKQRSHLQLTVRHREISAFRDVLLQVKTMTPQVRQQWLEDNSEAMRSAFSVFVDVSEKMLEQTPKDSVSMELTYQLITTLREAEALAAELFDQSSAQLQS